MYVNCQVDALDSQLISDAKMCACFVWCNIGKVSLKE